MVVITKKYRIQKWGANMETFCDTSATRYDAEGNFVEIFSYKDHRLNGDEYRVNGKEVTKEVFLSIKTKKMADEI